MFKKIPYRITGIELGEHAHHNYESILILFFHLVMNIHHWCVISATWRYSNSMPFMYLFNVTNCNL
jgi:hypothetical protein